MTKKISIGILAFFLFFTAVSLITGGVVWKQRGEAIAMENKIEAQYQTNKSDYDKMWKTFVEMTQISEIQAEQFKNVYTDLISNHNQDNKLLFKAIQESNPQLGTEVYTNLQRQIVADRGVFNNNQKKIIDVINQYNTFIQHEAIILSSITNRKTIDANKYIITSEKTEKVFQDKKDDVIDLTNKKD